MAKPAPELDRLYTVEEIAEHSRVNERTVRRWLDNGDLVEIRLGRRRLVAHRDYLAFLDARRNG